MVFSSHLFLFWFLPLALSGQFILARAPVRWRNLWLAFTGYVFYGWAEPRFLPLMWATTTLDWILSLVIARDRLDFWRIRGRPECLPRQAFSAQRSRLQRCALMLSVLSNLFALGFFKYFHFGVETWNAVVSSAGIHSAVVSTTLEVVLPLGISFYTFQALSYIIDVFRGEAAAMENFVDFSCFVSMFPHLVAGPILKFSFLSEQLRHRTLTLDMFARGVAFFLLGLSKKVLLANACGKIADFIFGAAARSLTEAWAGAVAYTLQIYFDFSGYSDMAIGLGLMFGFVFARNFNAPYAANSLTDFWRRWHISLSTWLREYLYIPLGGNRFGPVRTCFNLFLTMLLGGLWHGASWNFVLWGALHGGALVVERTAGRNFPTLRFPPVIARGLTLLVVVIGWVLFRAETLPEALSYLRSMLDLSPAQWAPKLAASPVQQPFVLGLLALAAGIVLFGRQTWDWTQSLSPAKALLSLGTGSVAVIALLTQDYNPFIYFIF
jgi:alginate O-acetyltransferase complex protein AlgI